MKNPFEVLGLDPYILRKFPDEAVGKLVRSAFRILILSVHEDIGKHSVIKEQGPDVEDKKPYFDSSKKVEEQSIRYEDMITAYNMLSTAKGRYLAFQAVKNKKEDDWRERVKNAELTAKESCKQVSVFSINFALNSVGALENETDDELVDITPLHTLYGCKLLVSGSLKDPIFYEICLDNDGWVKSIAKCKIVPARQVSFPKKQPWLFKGTMGKTDTFAIPQSEMGRHLSMRLVGVIDRGVYDDILGRPERLLKSRRMSRSTVPKVDLPFTRIHKSEIGNLLNTLSIDASHQKALVLCDANGNFYFPGTMRNKVCEKRDAG